MRFEAKNQEHKKAAQMGNFADVSKTVAEFWSRRSHLRLHRKRARPQSDADESEATSKRMRYIRHPEVTAGDWIRVERMGGPLYIAYVVSNGQSSDGLPQLTVRAFRAATILHDSADGPYADSADLRSECARKVNNAADERLAMVHLLFVYAGKVRFVGQP